MGQESKSWLLQLPLDCQSYSFVEPKHMHSKGQHATLHIMRLLLPVIHMPMPMEGALFNILRTTYQACKASVARHILNRGRELAFSHQACSPLRAISCSGQG